MDTEVAFPDTDGSGRERGRKRYSSVFGAVEAREGDIKHSEDAEKIRVYVKHQEKQGQLTQGKLRF